MSSCMYAHHVTRCCGRSAIVRRTLGTKPIFSSGLSQSSRASAGTSSSAGTLSQVIVSVAFAIGARVY